MAWNGCHVLQSVESSKAGDLSPLPPAPALCTWPGSGSEHGVGVGVGGRLQQAPLGSSLLRPWAHPHLALCDGVPHVAGWSPALGAAATGGGDWMPSEPASPKVRLVSSCKSEVDTQNKPRVMPTPSWMHVDAFSLPVSLLNFCSNGRVY